jgi:AraC-like DNA-binding protein
MLYEPTTLASATALLATSLREEYGIDPADIFASAGLPVALPHSPQERYPLTRIRELWALAREASGDETIGLKTGRYARPQHFYAFGYSWMASSTLLGAMQRLTRYFRIMSTAWVHVVLTETADSYALSSSFPDPARRPPREGIDCGLTGVLALCDIVAEKKIRPIRAELVRAMPAQHEVYREALGAPIRFGAEIGALHFDKAELLAPLPHGSPDIAKATDRIAELYIEALDPNKVASRVRRLLIDLLPSGKASQATVSARLNCSTSTLQRQLQSEGLSYRDVLESTQRSLAETYLRDRKHTHAQIAYLLGFSDQSNFSRAFKRWTNSTPRQFQASQERV